MNYYYDLPSDIQKMTEDFADKAIYDEYQPIHKDKMTLINKWFKDISMGIDDYDDTDQVKEKSCYSHEMMKDTGLLNHLPYLKSRMVSFLVSEEEYELLV